MKVTHVLIKKISYGRWKVSFDLLIGDTEISNLSFETTDSETIDQYESIKQDSLKEAFEFIGNHFEYKIENLLKQLTD